MLPRRITPLPFARPLVEAELSFVGVFLVKLARSDSGEDQKTWGRGSFLLEEKFPWQAKQNLNYLTLVFG